VASVLPGARQLETTRSCLPSPALGSVFRFGPPENWGNNERSATFKITGHHGNAAGGTRGVATRRDVDVSQVERNEKAEWMRVNFCRAAKTLSLRLRSSRKGKGRASNFRNYLRAIGAVATHLVASRLLSLDIRLLAISTKSRIGPLRRRSAESAETANLFVMFFVSLRRDIIKQRVSSQNISRERPRLRGSCRSRP
jgi:hypothetical protein